MIGGKHQLMPEKCPEGPAICPVAGGFRSRGHRGEAFELADQMQILHHRPIRAARKPEFFIQGGDDD